MTKNKGLLSILLGGDNNEEVPAVNPSTDVDIVEEEIEGEVEEEIETEDFESTNDGPFSEANLASLLPEITRNTTDIPYNPPMSVEEKIRRLEAEVPEEIRYLIPGLEMTEFLMTKEFNDNSENKKVLVKEIAARFGDLGYTEELLANESYEKLMELQQMDSDDMYR